MSYHILHQFDEQWLADLNQGDEGKGKSNSPKPESEDSQTGKRGKLTTRDSHRWAIIVLAVLMATFSLLFAIDATQRAEALQQRLDAVERQVAKIKSGT